MNRHPWRRKHLWQGLLFLIAAVLVFGNAVSLGAFFMPEASRSWAAPIALVLFGMGIFMLVKGEAFLESGSVTAEYYEAIAMAVAIAFMVRSFVVEPFKIPSGSMMPTLLVGDYLFVNKFAYGYRVPFTQKRILMTDPPRHGEIVVFEYPKDPTKDYIKRIVGLPGDRVAYRDKRLYINGQLVAQQVDGAYNYINEYDQRVESQRLTENLGSHPHAILVRPMANMDQFTDEVIPADHYFVMGDNRDNSNDSRYWGLVPAHRLVGRAVALFWSWDRIEGKPRWERIAQLIR
ncbi:MAG: signal peptidase I [Magnetococcales bacterium]|nr:signal peptidase I [Magnetococcales bacterium]